jgi:DNA replication protein DnaC
MSQPSTRTSYEEWHGFLGNRLMTDALLGRLRHFCTTLHIHGPSLREPQG